MISKRVFFYFCSIKTVKKTHTKPRYIAIKKFGPGSKVLFWVGTLYLRFSLWGRFWPILGHILKNRPFWVKNCLFGPLAQNKTFDPGPNYLIAMYRGLVWVFFTVLMEQKLKKIIFVKNRHGRDFFFLKGVFYQ